MTDRYTVVLSPRAEGHVDSLYAYIARESGEARADLVVGRVLDACHALSIFPKRGTQRDDLAPGLRIMGFRRHVTIAFVVEADRVVIHAVLGRGQDLNRAFDSDSL